MESGQSFIQRLHALCTMFVSCDKVAAAVVVVVVVVVIVVLVATAAAGAAVQ